MGYDVTLWASKERGPRIIGGEPGVWRPVERLLDAHCSGFTPRRQNRQYGVDFLDVICYLVDGEPCYGDPELPPGDEQGCWTPDWTRATEILTRLREAATAANDAYTLSALPQWEELVRLGQLNPESVVTISI